MQVRLLSRFAYGLAHFWGDTAVYARADEAARLRARSGVAAPLNEYACFVTQLLRSPHVRLRALRRWLHEVGVEEAFSELQGFLRSAFRRVPRVFDFHVS